MHARRHQGASISSGCLYCGTACAFYLPVISKAQTTAQNFVSRAFRSVPSCFDKSKSNLHSNTSVSLKAYAVVCISHCNLGLYFKLINLHSNPHGTCPETILKNVCDGKGNIIIYTGQYRNFSQLLTKRLTF